MKPLVWIVAYGERDIKDATATTEALRHLYPDVPVVVHDNSSDNVGYCRAVSIGIEQMLSGGHDILWILSPDATPRQGALEGAAHRMAVSPACGIVGSLQLDPEDPDLVRHGGTIIAYPAGVHVCGKLSEGIGTYPSMQKWVNSASMFIRRQCAQEIGGFDPDLFLFYGESDYCYRARLAGWEVWYEPRSAVTHRLSTSKNAVETVERDRAVFAAKWLGHPLWRLLDTISAPIPR